MVSPIDTIAHLKKQKGFKITLFYFLGLCLSTIFWFSIKANFDLVFMTNDGIRSLWTTLLSLIFFSLFLAEFAHSAYFFGKFYLTLGLIILANAPYFIVFGPSLFSLEGFLILTLCLYFWAKKICLHGEKYITAGPIISGRNGLRMAISIFLFVIAFSFYISIAYRGQMNYFAPRLEKYAVDLSHQGMRWALPGYDKKLPIDDFLHLLIKNKVWSKFIVADNNTNLDNPEVVQAMKEGLEKKLSVSLEGRDTDFLVTYLIHDYVGQHLMRSQKIFSGAAAIAFFLFMKLFMVVYCLLIRLFSWIWLRLFLWLKIVRKTTKTVAIEQIVI
jgi:hypothetical protein